MTTELPDLYYFPTSFYSQKVLLAFAEKQIPVNKCRVNLGQFENYSEWYMKINPKGQVPVLVDEGKIIPDSSAIIKYADDTYEGPVLMPDLGKEKWLYFQEKCEEIRVEVLTYGAIIHTDLITDSFIPPVMQSKMGAAIKNRSRSKKLQALCEENPALHEVYSKKLLECKEMESQVFDRVKVEEEVEKVRKILTEVDETITERKQEWLCGPDVTVADICVAVLLQRLKLAGYATTLWEGGRLPMVAAYYERLLYWKPFRDVCVQGTGTTNVLNFPIGDNALRLIPMFVSGSVLLIALGLGYLVYQNM